MMTLAEAFNEWMRRYIEDPDGFEREWVTIRRHEDQTANEKDISYGADCVAMLKEIMGVHTLSVTALSDLPAVTQESRPVAWDRAGRQPYD